jgi:quercetin dioxygenase-like cupin family protein
MVLKAPHLYTGRNKLPKPVVPYPFEKRSKGYQRVALVDLSNGAVHQATGICELQPNGSVDYCLHTNEEAIYVLEGELEVLRDREAFRLSKDDYVFVPYGVSHAYRNTGDKVVRWFEAQSPQPKPAGGWQDTFFFKAQWPKEVTRPNFDDPRTRYMDHFKEVGGESPQVIGVQGLTVREFITPELGSLHMVVHRGHLEPGGTVPLHDHSVEESFYALSGEMDLEIEGTVYKLRTGDVALAGVGAAHSWHNIGKEPFRWIETITPQFVAPSSTRIYSYWEKLKILQDG